MVGHLCSYLQFLLLINICLSLVSAVTINIICVSKDGTVFIFRPRNGEQACRTEDKYSFWLPTINSQVAYFCLTLLLLSLLLLLLLLLLLVSVCYLFIPNHSQEILDKEKRVISLKF